MALNATDLGGRVVGVSCKDTGEKRKKNEGAMRSAKEGKGRVPGAAGGKETTI